MKRGKLIAGAIILAGTVFAFASTAPATVTCLMDNQTMMPTHQTRSEPGGITMCEYAHDTPVTNGGGNGGGGGRYGHDPVPAQIIHHSVWIRC